MVHFKDTTMKFGEHVLENTNEKSIYTLYVMDAFNRPHSTIQSRLNNNTNVFPAIFNIYNISYLTYGKENIRVPCRRIQIKIPQ